MLRICRFLRVASVRKVQCGNNQGTLAAIRLRQAGGVVLGCVVLLPTGEASAEQVSVRHTEGLLHGFLALRTLEGKSLADGELTQFAEGDRVKSHLVFHFKDGSRYEETAFFSQRGKFRLLSDHVIQQGPSFKHPMKTSIDAATGQVMVRY